MDLRGIEGNRGQAAVGEFSVHAGRADRALGGRGSATIGAGRDAVANKVFDVAIGQQIIRAGTVPSVLTEEEHGVGIGDGGVAHQIAALAQPSGGQHNLLVA